jgi:hypothetical protein
MRNLPDMPAQIKLTQRRGTTLINLAGAALIIATLYVGLFLLKCLGIVDLAQSRRRLTLYRCHASFRWIWPALH